MITKFFDVFIPLELTIDVRPANQMLRIKAEVMPVCLMGRRPVNCDRETARLLIKQRKPEEGQRSSVLIENQRHYNHGNGRTVYLASIIRSPKSPKVVVS